MDAKPLRGFRVHGDENAVPSLAGGKTLHTRNKSSPALYTLATMGAPKPTAKRTAFGDVSNTVHANRPVRDDAASAAKVALEVKQNNVELQPEQKAALPLLKPPHRPASITVSIKSIINNAANISLATKSATDTNQQGATTANTRKALTKKNTTVFKDYSTVLQTTQELPNLVDAHAPVLGDINPQAPLQKAPKVRGETRQKSLPKVQNTPYPIVVQQDTVPAASKVSETTKIEVASETLEEKVGKEKNFEQKANKPVKKPIHILEDESPVIPTSQAGSVPEEVGAPVALPAARKESISKAVLQTLSEPEEYWDEEDEEEENYDEDGYVTARSFRSRGENITGNATTTLVPRVNVKTRKEIAAAKELVESARTIEDIEDDYWDTSMVVEYNDEIFSYMRELEIKMQPNPHYMDFQTEIQWSMRSVLMDWLVQVHNRLQLLPETLFLCANYVDRFLSCKIVSLGKLQLVGATALFVAAKYEETNCPGVHDMVYMVDGGYTADEILKAERFMLSMLQFELGWPSPMSFLRRISKADDYDLETRTLAKYFLELTIMDERFLGCPPSFTAAGAHCLARMMLKKGNWSPSHVYYSNYTYSQLYSLVQLLFECCEVPTTHHSAIYDKYQDKRYMNASNFARNQIREGFQVVDVATNNAQTFLNFYDKAAWPAQK